MAANRRKESVWRQIGALLAPILVLLAVVWLAPPQPVIDPDARLPRRPRPPSDELRLPPGVTSFTAPQFEAITPRKLESIVEEMSAIEENTLAVPIPREDITELADEREVALEVTGARAAVAAIATGFRSPDGVAVDPRNGNVFLADEATDQILYVTPRGRKRTLTDSSSRLYVSEGRTGYRIAPVHSPEGLAFDGRGNLYIAEDYPGGRILSIAVEPSGRIGPAQHHQIPGDWSTFAWESVAVSANDELLVAGSNAEGASGQSAGMVTGAILYRDASGRWWVPLLRPGASFSAVAFSRDGRFAVYADEIAGTIGWIDLTTRDLREGASQITCSSPEGLAILPDGRIAVAEEGGRVRLIDPESHQFRVAAERLGDIESIVWDDAGKRLLVTSDGRGELLELTMSDPWRAEGDRMASVATSAQGEIRSIPKRAPEFLRPLLDATGQASSTGDLTRALSDLANRMPVIAADSRVTLLGSTEDIIDPVVHIRFVALDPNRLNFDTPGTEFSLSAVILRTQSGREYRTTRARIAVLSGNMWVGKFFNHGTFDLSIPFAYQANIGPQGHAVIHFAGLGRSPDLSIAINPANPRESFMIVTHLDGAIEQYRLERAADGSTDNWVVSLPPRRPQNWLDITPVDAPPSAPST